MKNNRLLYSLLGLVLVLLVGYTVAKKQGWVGKPTGVEVLVAKARAGAEFAVTQLFLDAAAYTALVSRVRAHGCDLPIIPGIMPITSLAQLRRFAELSGVAVPQRIEQRLTALGDDPAAVRAEGLAIAIELCRELLDADAPGLHFYTLNRSTATLEIYEALGIDAAV